MGQWLVGVGGYGMGWGTLDVMETVSLQMSTSDLLTTPNNEFFYAKYVVGLTVCH